MSLLATLASAGAMCAAQTAAASTFPTTELLDSFERAAENPLSDGGKWSKLAWTKTIGRVYSEKYGWVPKEGGAGAPESEADGAYWNVQEFGSAAVSTHIYAENLHDYVALWCDTTGTGSKNGYRLRVVGLAKGYAFKLVLEKWVSGSSTVLGESPEVLFKGASSENVVGITAINGKVSAWYGTTEAGLAAKVEASDSTFSRGYIGIEGTNDGAYGETQFRASSPFFPATESVDTFERAAENPLSNGGKWSKLAWTKTIGRVYSEKFGWVPKEGGLEAPESEADGAYWNAGGSTSPAVSVHIYAENRRDYVGIWCDTTGSGSKNGYRVKVVGTATNYGFKLILEKWVSGSKTQLGESPEIYFKGGSSENIVGITAINGKIAAWYGTTEGNLAVKVEASDATFSHGHVGIEGTDNSAFGETKYRASLNESAPYNTAIPAAFGPAQDYHYEEAVVGSWTGTAPITYTYQWERCVPYGSCTPIGAATGVYYDAQPADVGDAVRVEVTATNSVGSSSAYSDTTAIITEDPCKPASHHCYAVVEQDGVTTAGLNVAIETSYAAVPYWKEDFVDNEAWSGLGPKKWVEGGATSGVFYNGGATPGYVYFTATSYGEHEYYESDFENGPGGNNYFPVDEHYVANNIWYITAGNDLVGYADEPTTASDIEAGLEETNDNITNWGHLDNLSWWNAYDGAKEEGWSPETKYDRPGLTCISLQGDKEAYFVANGNPCELGDDTAPNSPMSGNLVTEPTATPSPLTAKSALEVGQSFAFRDGGGVTPKSIEVFSTTEATAMAVAQPRASLPSSDASSSALLAEPVYVDVMSGDFTLTDAPVPKGESSPTGESLVVVANARTGYVLNIALTPSPPTSLLALGPVVASK
ncbi:MAG TPA: hypothetical protein VMU32_12825 [Solirubrobacteraceae bacterium]|nr:hypothetical protein [Solirubrobacteraceae bacterium]